MKWITGLVATSAVVLLSACAGKGPDPLVMGEPNCDLPCWRGIRPGHTTESEALAAVRGMEDVDKFTTAESFIYFAYTEHRSNRMHVDQRGVVDWIELDPKATNLSQVVGRFGEPSYVRIIQEAEASGFEVYLPAKGLIFMGPWSWNFLADGWAMGPHSRVTLIRLAKPDQSIDEILELLEGKDRARALRHIMIPWKGYGTYKWPD